MTLWAFGEKTIQSTVFFSTPRTAVVTYRYLPQLDRVSFEKEGPVLPVLVQS